MKLLDKMLDHLEEEVDGARSYAEKYIEHKARGDMARAGKYKEMAMDELKHAGYLRDFDMADAAALKKAYTLTEAEQESWDHGHKHLNDHMAMVERLLSM